MNETLTDEKKWFASKGVWGGIVAVLAGILALFGFSVSPAEQANVVELASGLAASIGGAIAIWGRIVATKAIAGGGT